MALKPTIYKFRLALSDFTRDYYDNLNLTIALHPSETLERMLVRLLAYCIHAQEGLCFTKGLSETEQPDIWLRSLDDKVQIWVDVGEPSVERLKKACRLAEEVYVYCFNSKADVWWAQNKNKLSRFQLSIFQFDWDSVQALSSRLQRTMDISISLSPNSIYLACDPGEYEINYSILQEV